jgi:hypothetical protein
MRVVVYACVRATEVGRSAVSLTHQVELCEGFVAARGWRTDVPPYLADRAEGSEAPAALRRLLDDAATGLFAGVVVHDLSRLAPDALGALNVVRLLTTAGLSLASVVDRVDATTDHRVMDALLALAAMPAPTPAPIYPLPGRAGRLPYGYARRDALTVDPDRAGIVRAVFAWRDAGDSLADIAARLTDQGVPTARDGQRWYASTVRGLLMQEVIYRGGDVDSGPWPAILTSDALEEAQRQGASDGSARKPAVAEAEVSTGRSPIRQKTGWAVWE